MSRKSIDYLVGLHEERARQRSRGFAMDALTVARNLRADEHRKAAIAAAFPAVAAAMDGLELAQASALELAVRALGLPIPDDADPVALIEAHIAGRRARPAAMDSAFTPSAAVAEAFRSGERFHSYSGGTMDGVEASDFVGKYTSSK